MVGFNMGSTPFGENKIYSHDNRRNRGKATPYDYDELRPIRQFLNDWKHSKNEVFFLSYRTVCGALFGGIVGLMLHPMIRHSPYVQRKLAMSFRATDLFPLDTAKVVVGKVLPYYMTIGAITITAGTFISELYDRTICSNKFMKYTVLGAIDLALLFAVFGPVGTWTNGFLAGLVFGPVLCAVKTTKALASMGNYGNSVEYMAHVSKEDQEKYELQEARLMKLRPR